MTRLVRFANNAASRLAANLNAVGTTCTVTPGDGAKFPTLSAGQFFMATLVRADGTKEIVRVTGRATDTFTIVRAAESVGGVQAAATFSAGDRIELRMTAGSLATEFDRLDAAAFITVLNRSANYTVLAADISSLIRVDSTAAPRTITLPLISSLPGDEFEILVAKVSGDDNAVTIAAAGSDTINGLATATLQQQWAGAWLIADRATNTWTAINSGAGGSVGTWNVNTFTGAGTPGPFTLTGDPGSKFNTLVWVGGVYQEKSTYTVVGNQITMGGNVPVGVVVEVSWGSPISFGVPSDGAVTTPKLGAQSVTTEKLADDAVTFDKLQNLPTSSLVGRTQAGTGNAEAVTVGAGLTMSGGTLTNPSAGGLPQSATTGTLVAADEGRLLLLAAGITVPANVFSVGKAVSLYNNTAGSLTITQGAGLTLRQVGTTNTGNRQLAARGLVTVLFISATEAVISGGGLS